MLLAVFFAAATVAGFVGLSLAGPAHRRDLYALPALGTCALILTFAALGVAILQ
ncbi:hypothetical protein ACWGI8_00870 [Streptomyces sp. NPDC054841]